MKQTIKLLILTLCISFSGWAQVDTVKMFLLAGQSNMQGSNCQTTRLESLVSIKNSPPPHEDKLFTEISSYYEKDGGFGNGYDAAQARVVARNLDTNGLVTADLLDSLQSVQIYYANYRYHATLVGTPNVLSGSLFPKYGANTKQYGPELLIGHKLTESLKEDIIFVKVAMGGSDLHKRWRSPSAEARLGKADAESLYPALVEHAEKVMSDPGVYFPKYKGKTVVVKPVGFIWFQGFNDQFEAEYYNNYKQNLTDLIKDLRTDMNNPDLLVAIGQSHTDGNTGGKTVMSAQAAVADADDKAGWAVTNDLSNFYHYDPGAMIVIGSRLGEKMASLLPEKDDVSNQLVANKKSGAVTMRHSAIDKKLFFSTGNYSTDELTVKIVNTKGQNILSTQLSGENRSVDISHISTGVYIVSVLQNGMRVTTGMFAKKK